MSLISSTLVQDTLGKTQKTGGHPFVTSECRKEDIEIVSTHSKKKLNLSRKYQSDSEDKETNRSHPLKNNFLRDPSPLVLEIQCKKESERFSKNSSSKKNNSNSSSNYFMSKRLGIASEISENPHNSSKRSMSNDPLRKPQPRLEGKIQSFILKRSSAINF